MGAIVACFGSCLPRLQCFGMQCGMQHSNPSSYESNTCKPVAAFDTQGIRLPCQQTEEDVWSDTCVVCQDLYASDYLS